MEQRERDQAIRQAISERLLRRAATDLEFRRLLIDNPKSALARELGIDVPDHIHVTVLPESENHLFIVIPPLSGEVDSTGVARMAHASPAYGGMTTSATGMDRLVDKPAYGGNSPLAATGIDRLAPQSAAYPSR